ncbi:nucleotidyltransferase family protein [Sphingomonas sp.]|uniref:nucleotidyltransferase family protein n=1 Tax=Sphingomonas sp. TaxID=28214 RepID=UPI0025DFEFED|nr:nucleotidyltransferase family protein [Sphingomonas sp.]
MIDSSEVAAILLAAGQSSRFVGGNKLLADLHGQPLVLYAAQRIVALDTGRRIAVCGPEVGEVLAPLGFEIVAMPEPPVGMARSLALAVAEVGSKYRAALVCLGDMPFVRLAHLKALLAKFDADQCPLVSSIDGEIAMPPAIFAAGYFTRLREGGGDQGARSLLAGAAHLAARAGELSDIDTIAELSAGRNGDGLAIDLQ